MTGPFVVRRRNWRALRAAPGGPWLTRLPGAVPVAACDSAEDAEAVRADLEATARAGVNPFRCGHTLADVTNLPPFVFKDYLLDDGIRPAKSDSLAQIHWDKWWAARSPNWPPAVRDRVWDALDRVTFYDIVGRPADGSGTRVVVVEALPAGLAGRQWHARPPEGGRLRGAYSDPATAAAASKRLPGGRPPGPTRDPFHRAPTTAREPLDQVVPIDYTPAADGSSARRVWCVARVALSVAVRIDAGVIGPEYQFDRYHHADGVEDHLVPEAGFADRADAEAYRADAEWAIRRLLNPFRFALGLDDLSRDIWRFRPGVKALGIAPPPAANTHKVTWWAREVSTHGDDVFHAAWDLLDRLTFYRVVELDGG